MVRLRLAARRRGRRPVTIAPGQRAPRGKATLEAVFSYLGRPFLVWRKGQWRRAWGWMELRETRLDIGGRLAAACDVPDLELFPARYAGVQTVRFSAAPPGYVWLAGIRSASIAVLSSPSGLLSAAETMSGGDNRK
jgi:hypothetical protein